MDELWWKLLNRFNGASPPGGEEVVAGFARGLDRNKSSIMPYSGLGIQEPRDPPGGFLDLMLGVQNKSGQP